MMNLVLSLHTEDQEQAWVRLETGRPFSVRIGRAPEAELVVPDTVPEELRLSVSRFHARLFSHNGTLWLEDLDSHNFTWLNERIVFLPTPVKLPAELRLGGVRLSLRSEEGRPDLPSAPLAPHAARAGERPAADIASTRRSELGLRAKEQLHWLSALAAVAELAAAARRASSLCKDVEEFSAGVLGAERVTLHHNLSWPEFLALTIKLEIPNELLHEHGIDTTTQAMRSQYAHLRQDAGARQCWIINVPGGQSCRHCLLEAHFDQQRAGHELSDDADTFVHFAVRMIQPLLAALAELEAERAAVIESVPHLPSAHMIQLCESERLWGNSVDHRKSMYFAELAAKRYLGAFQGDRKLSVLFFLGESGTGKSALARVIHRLSDHAAQPFLELNCAAIPITLAESELFGYEKGAHDKAYTAKAGWFEAAAGGTLFLDEIGKTTAEFQSKLLKVLDTGEFSRLGSNSTRKTHCYVILATSEDPVSLCESGRLLREFWYRVGAFTITLAPLRERPDDIALLVQRKLQHMNAEHPDDPPKRMSDKAFALFKAYHWPGNIRELIQYLEVAYALTPPDQPIIDVPHLPESFCRGVGVTQGPRPEAVLAALARKRWDDYMEIAERQYLVALIAACEGNLSEVARRAEKSYQTIHNKLREVRQWLQETSGAEAELEKKQLQEIAGKWWHVIMREGD
ncbi:MAG: sigma 54-interacting transcriptional regulator [Candidatus Hydrogenedentes bacterium]|nr:sigma 54-interacting transcriptional regulator [Candidatus Hydrogenedentota bacterium]